jgi:hypothetical protein
MMGRDRLKYFKRPMVPFLPAVPPDTLLAPAASASSSSASAQQAQVVETPEPPTKTVGVQTMYRESEVSVTPHRVNFVSFTHA